MTTESEALPQAEVYADYAVELVRYATVLVGPDDAQDVVSTAMLRTLEAGRWDAIKHHRAYLYRAVSNAASNHARSGSRRRDREARTARSHVVYPPDVFPEVREAIERLSVRQRAVIYLTYWEDLSDSDISELLGISAGSVRRHLARARTHLRRTL